MATSSHIINNIYVCSSHILREHPMFNTNEKILNSLNVMECYHDKPFWATNYKYIELKDTVD